jgi:putative glutamine amidotransferase
VTTRAVVGISAHVESITDADGDTLLHYVAGVPYARAVHRGGAIPVILPIVDVDDVDALLDTVDAVVITGGCDVDPHNYGAEPHAQLGAIDPARDTSDFALARAAVARNQPTLAICRGIQVLNVALGGTLVQHVDDHMRVDTYNQDTHRVAVDPSSRLAAVVGSDLGVNSLHHQVLDRVADGLRAVARNSDGQVEAVEVDHADQVLGVQWHPEMLRHRDDHLALFEWLAEAGLAWRTRRSA